MADCNCISEVNKDLAARGENAAIVTNLFGPPRATVGTYEVRKIRGKRAPILVASYCPFCGREYEDRSNG